MVNTAVRKNGPGPAKSAGSGEGDVACLSLEEGVALLDRQARKYLGMSGAEFVEKYRAGEIEDPGSTTVMRVAMLIPFAEP
ncbi:MAG TPA: hypothetical protein VH482_10415 [Thermomicrobiales bacterium]